MPTKPTKAEQARIDALALLDETVEGKIFFDEELVTAEIAVKFLAFLKAKDRDGIYNKAFKEHYKSVILTEENALVFQQVVEPFLVNEEIVLYKALSETRSNYVNIGILVDDDIVIELNKLSGDEAVDMAVNQKLRLR